MKHNRIQWVDTCRAICIFFVVMTHFGVNGNVFHPFYRYFFLTLFFFLSGYVAKDRSFIDSFKKIVKSLLIPYFSLSIIVCVFSPSFVLSVCNHNVLQYLCECLNRIIDGNSLWFISCLIVVQIEYCFLYKILFSKQSIIFQVVVSFLLISSVIFIAGDTPNRLPWNLDTSICALGYFSLGGGIKRLSINVLRPSKISRVFSILLMVVYIVICYGLNSLGLGKFDMHNNMYGNFPWLHIPMSLFACSVIIYFSMNFRFGQLTSLFGQHSLTIYALEGIGAYFFGKAFSLIGCSTYIMKSFPNLYSIVFVFLICMFCLGLSILIERYIPFIIGKSNR